MHRSDATVIDADDRETTVAAYADDERLLIDLGHLEAATGWSLKPEGLCRGDVCVPTRAWPDLVVETGAAGGSGTERAVDLALFGRLTGQPTVVDPAIGIAAFGTPARVRAERLATLEAPEFRVTDLAGESVALADFRGRKKLLVAFASW